MWEADFYDTDLAATSATIGDFRRLTVTDRLYLPSSFELELRASHRAIGRLLPSHDIHGTEVRPGGSRFAVIAGRPYRMWEAPLYQEGREEATWTLRGDDAAYLDQRGVFPPASQSHQVETGSAAERMRAFVQAQAVDPADAKWVVPHLTAPTVDPAGAAGRTEARYDNLAVLLAGIGEEAGVGWDVRFDGSGFVWEPVVGNDLTDVVVVSTPLGTSREFTYSYDGREQPTWLVVAGQDEGADRTIREYGAGVGWSARFAFRDARDTDEEAAHARRAAETLHDPGPAVTVDVSTLRVDAELGDVVTVANGAVGISLPARIVEIETTVRPGSQFRRRLALGRRFPPGLGRDRDPSSAPTVERT